MTPIPKWLIWAVTFRKWRKARRIGRTFYTAAKWAIALECMQ